MSPTSAASTIPTLAAITQSVVSEVGAVVAWTAAGVGALIGVHRWSDAILEKKIATVAQRDLVQQKLNQIHSDIGDLKTGYRTLDTKLDNLSTEVAYLRGAEEGRGIAVGETEALAADCPARLRLKSDPPT